MGLSSLRSKADKAALLFQESRGEDVSCLLQLLPAAYIPGPMVVSPIFKAKGCYQVLFTVHHSGPSLLASSLTKTKMGSPFLKICMIRLDNHG